MSCEQTLLDVIFFIRFNKQHRVIYRRTTIDISYVFDRNMEQRVKCIER